MAETFFTIYTGEAGRVDIGYDFTQNAANNTTALTVKAYLVKTNGAYTSFNNYHKTFTLTVNGTATLIAFDFDFRNMSTGVRYLITTASRTISHNSDGSVGNVPVSVYYKSDTSGLGTVSGSTSIAISTIPRASTPTLSATTTAIGSAVTINTNRASTSFTHAITYSFGSASGTIATGVGTSYSWTLPASLANQIPNTTSGSGSIKLKTYSGTTLIGEKSIAFTATVPDTSAFQPTASGLTASISGSGRDKTIGKYVQSISKVYMSFSSTANGGATIKSNSINIKKGTSTNSMTVNGTSGTSGTVTSSGVYTITATTTDSRGRSKTTSITITVEAYAVPKITSFTASRQSTTKTSVSTVRNGTYTYMSNSNPLSVVIARRPRGGSYTNLNTTAGTTSGTLLGTYVSTGNSETSSYDFKLTITDSFGNSAVGEITVPTSSVALSIAGDVGIGVGKLHEQGALDLAGDFFINGKNYNSSIVYHYEVPQTSMISQTSQVLIQLPYSVGFPGAFLVTVTANANPGGAAGYRSYFVGILTAPGNWNGSIVYLKPTWTEISTHNGMGTLVIEPRAIVSGAYTDIAQYGNQANSALYGLIISGFSTGYPTISARAVAVTVRRLY